MQEIRPSLYLFSTFNPQINLSFNQYLLSGNQNVLIHTGNFVQAKALIPDIKKILGSKTLDYIFISNFEGDECGGVSVIRENFPQVQPVCSAITARQLAGFGLGDQALAMAPGDNLLLGAHELQFIAYPAEMHLWEGLLAFEKNQSILFSSDLFLRQGKSDPPVIQAAWPEELSNIGSEQIANPQKLEELKKTLLDLPVKFIATGHGPCVKING